MKKNILLITLCTICLNLFAEKVEIDGIGYNLINKTKTAEVTQKDSPYFGNIIIPSSIVYNDEIYIVNSISEDAFLYSSIESITIGNEVKSIGKFAFLGCKHLSSINFGKSVEEIGQHSFEHCISLRSVMIPKSVRKIYGEIFTDCPNLEIISVDSENHVYDSRDNCNAIIETETNALQNGCKSTIIPSTIVSISNSAFRACGSLSSIEIPNNVTSIGGLAFFQCEELTKVIVGCKVNDIGESAFEECTELKDFYCYAKEVPSVGNMTFRNSLIEYATLHVPAESIEKYKADFVFGQFGNIIALSDSEMTNINAVSITPHKTMIYTLDGIQHKDTQEGLNIIKSEDGKTRKIYIKK